MKNNENTETIKVIYRSLQHFVVVVVVVVKNEN